MGENYPHRLAGLGWAGGKNPCVQDGYPQWIHSQIPYSPNQCYFEPFAGMLGILLQRPRCAGEVVNDSNGQLVNWWRQVRDNHRELHRMWMATPNSRELFQEAKDVLESGGSGELARAWAFMYLVSYSLLKSAQNAGWVMPVSGRSGGGRFLRQSHWDALSARLREVVIENRCALEILERTSRLPAVSTKGREAIVYCDPPYPNSMDTNKSIYEGGLDYGEMSELLQAHKCKVAISGIEDDWDHLGWSKREYKIQNRLGADPERKRTKRSEYLWINYEAHSTLFG